MTEIKCWSVSQKPQTWASELTGQWVKEKETSLKCKQRKWWRYSIQGSIAIWSSRISLTILDDHELLPLPSVLNTETVRSSVGSVNVYHITWGHILENGHFRSTAMTTSNVLIPNFNLLPSGKVREGMKVIAVFLNRRAAPRYRALASIITGRERPEESTVCYKISLVQLITNLNVMWIVGFITKDFLESLLSVLCRDIALLSSLLVLWLRRVQGDVADLLWLFWNCSTHITRTSDGNVVSCSPL